MKYEIKIGLHIYMHTYIEQQRTQNKNYKMHFLKKNIRTLCGRLANRALRKRVSSL